MYFKYKDQVQFYMVYIREAHPTDGWQTASNERDKILFEQPKTEKDRAAIAGEMCTALKLHLPALMDKLDDKVNKDYSGWPDRLYLIGKDGKIAYKGGPGPRGFKPEELERAIGLELLINE